MNKQNVKVMVGQTWDTDFGERSVFEIKGELISYKMIDRGDYNVYTLSLNDFKSASKFKPANDLEWLACNCDKEFIPTGDLSANLNLAKQGNKAVLGDYRYLSNSYTPRQVIDMRIHLGLEPENWSGCKVINNPDVGVVLNNPDIAEEGNFNISGSSEYGKALLESRGFGLADISAEDGVSPLKFGAIPDVKPVYTKAMSDAGDRPLVGMECHVKFLNSNYDCKILGYDGDEVWFKGVHLMVHKTISIHGCVFSTIDTRTDEEKLIDDIVSLVEHAQSKGNSPAALVKMLFDAESINITRKS